MPSGARDLASGMLKLNSLFIAGISALLSLVSGTSIYLALGIASTAFFSWRVFKDDLKNLRITSLNLAGLLTSAMALWALGAPFSVSLIRMLITFIIAWGIYQTFDGSIGGGDVRLLSLAALFLSTDQLLVSLLISSTAGLFVAQAFKLKKLPFGSLLIVGSWISFLIIRA